MLGLPNHTASMNENENRIDTLLLVLGGLFLLCNIVVFFGANLRPSAWFYYLDMRCWPLYFSAFFWIVAIWVAAELTEFVENYRLIVRIVAVVGILPLMVLALRDFQSVLGAGNAIWYGVIAIMAAFCALRSLFLLHAFHNEGKGGVDMEEAVWFLGLSGFLWTVLIIIGIMYIIPVRAQIYGHIEGLEGLDGFVTQSLLSTCSHGVETLIRTGQGSFGIRALTFLVFTLPIAFLCVAGKWALIFLSRMGEE